MALSPFKCKSKGCRKSFTATMGTLYERSHILLHKWLLATHLMCASKKGISAHQLYRMLGFGSYKTAWFMAHRIRAAMTETNPVPIGGAGKVVEVDETYIGGKEGNKHANKRAAKKDVFGPKEAVVSLVERGGEVWSFHVPNVTAKTLRGVIGTYHHVSDAQLSRYLGEFDFRYNFRADLGVTDAMRRRSGARRGRHKRLMYDQPRQAA